MSVMTLSPGLESEGAGACCFPMLVGDLGGTHIRLGRVEALGNVPSGVAEMACRDHDGLEAAIEHYLTRHSVGKSRPRGAALAVAAPMDVNPIRMTNLDWTVDAQGLSERFGFTCLRLVNDFEALAMALPYLRGEDFRLVGSAPVDQTRTMGVIGPGTGLGVAAAVPVEGAAGTWHAISGEGGHVTLSGLDEVESAVIAHARKEHGHVSAERLLSGLGLPTLRRAVAAAEGFALSADLDARAIGESALRNDDPLNRRTVEMFCGLLGGVAGNLALTLGARGAVFLGGGILPRWGRFFEESAFRDRFQAKGRFSGYLSRIGTAVITQPHATLLGLARTSIHRDRRAYASASAFSHQK